MKLDEALFQEKIEIVRRLSAGVPKIINIDLGAAIVDQEFGIAGNIFYIYTAPDEAEYVGIKVNETREPMINYSVHTGLETPFYRLYITTPAGQAGMLQIIYGTEAPELLRILDNRSTTAAGVGGILDELRGDVTPEDWDEETVGAVQQMVMAANTLRKSFSIQAESTNTGIIYVGFDNTVTANKWWAELLPSQSCNGDDYRGPIHVIGSAAGQDYGFAEV